MTLLPTAGCKNVIGMCSSPSREARNVVMKAVLSPQQFTLSFWSWREHPGKQTSITQDHSRWKKTLKRQFTDMPEPLDAVSSLPLAILQSLCSSKQIQKDRTGTCNSVGLKPADDPLCLPSVLPFYTKCYLEKQKCLKSMHYMLKK